MDCPQGMFEAREDECLKLNQAIYGLVQAARQFWKKLVKILKTLGFKGGYPDPCLMMKKDHEGIVFIALYVDDCLCIGDNEAIMKLARDLEDSGL